MIALRFEKPGSISKIDCPIPVPGKNEVLIKVAYSGICGTDLHILKGESPAETNITLGHEFSGFVEDLGQNVTGFSKGQAVCIDPNNYCGTCEACRKGAVHFCSNLKPTGVAYDGGWAEYCCVPVSQVYSVPENFPLEWGALVEPLSCIIHGWDRLQPLDSSVHILIMGSGLIGLLWGLLLKYHGFESILFSEPNQARLKNAKALGFEALQPFAIDHRSKGFDVIVDCSGNEQALEAATNWANQMGKILYFGICPQNRKIQIEPFSVFQKELTILGSVINPFTFSRAIELVQRIQVPLNKLGVSFFPLSAFRTALKHARESTVNKVIFVMKK